ncbi:MULTISPECIES: amino acid ABC transporter permease [Pelosinus]|uniref:Polar amino acid ABC transporter, inner membrane subunit n=1 Tax=Pelosinus fermentans B4 TaxID=1149862 RepID=I8RHJ9_9FIRM|nr:MULTISPECIES: amino acid ABC transporter permease [Pelosinus]EIW19248.1 polar amino acid ABC transporter, inner membrane subunit [Pelosinus fermentans B4]EIW25021.1 polar amino acid ABC transporter, inner membrane subunit [Pelosinus fermentans A11]OAM96229.1 polar amino acid ABC transporter, inner membrane subunit [Pelosinus fermentans DSM 17108]SDR37786.1 amino acid ABC transporter membrane protein 1, PAAT family [Pelosinus fermentans]
MPGPFAGFKWLALVNDWSVFAEGFVQTILLSALGLTLALGLGIFFGLLGTSHVKLFKLLNRVYVEFIQNTPLVIQIFFLYHGLPHLGIMLPVFVVGVLGVGVYHGAYIAEVIRAGVESVPRGQLEAAYSQGFSYWGAMIHIVLPQAKRISYPPLTNQAVNLIKNTSVLAMVAGGELMYHADSWSSNNLYYGPSYVATGLLYLSLCFPLATFAKRMERKLEVSS